MPIFWPNKSKTLYPRPWCLAPMFWFCSYIHLLKLYNRVGKLRLKEIDRMRCICTLFDWFRKEAILVSRYRRFPPLIQKRLCTLRYKARYLLRNLCASALYKSFVNTLLTFNNVFVSQGTLRVLLVLLHDFPEFLCDYHFSFCDVIPPNCIQMRNLILSAFPRNMRLPDPFTPNLKVCTAPWYSTYLYYYIWYCC